MKKPVPVIERLPKDILNALDELDRKKLQHQADIIKGVVPTECTAEEIELLGEELYQLIMEKYDSFDRPVFDPNTIEAYRELTREEVERPVFDPNTIEGYRELTREEVERMAFDSNTPEERASECQALLVFADKIEKGSHDSPFFPGQKIPRQRISFIQYDDDPIEIKILD